MPLARVVRPLLAAGALLGGLYVLAVLGVSLASRERVLGPDAPKRFCGFYLDCHRMVTLLDVERVPAIGDRTAGGVFLIVTLRLSSDAKRAVLRTGPMTAVVRDAAGRRYARFPEAERLLSEDGTAGLPDTALGPGGSVVTRIVFDLPPDAANPRLHVRDSHPLAVLSEFVLLGDEDSALHARTTFAL